MRTRDVTRRTQWEMFVLFAKSPRLVNSRGLKLKRGGKCYSSLKHLPGIAEEEPESHKGFQPRQGKASFRAFVNFVTVGSILSGFFAPVARM